MDDEMINNSIIVGDTGNANHAEILNSQIPDENAPAIVSLSGGLDSTACLFWAIKHTGAQNVVAISVVYGQRHDIEIKKAIKTCATLGVVHDIINMSKVFGINKSVSSLMAGSTKKVEQGVDYGEIDGVPSTYVPNRNMVIGSVLATIAMQYYPKQRVRVVLGIHQSDADAAYPDCTTKFADSMYDTLKESTGGLVEFVTPLLRMKKKDVVKFAIANGMGIEDFDCTWSCYNEPMRIRGKHRVLQCGRCPTCRERIRALVDNHILRSYRDITSRYSILPEEAKKFLGEE